jgi:hypothetical protein
MLLLDDQPARLSRRQLLRQTALTLGGVSGLGVLDPAPSLAHAAAAPRPIPGGFDQSFNLVPNGAFFHALPPGIGFDMSTITDFKGVVAGSEIRGTAHGSDGSTFDFDTDMRFMRGTYVGLDGRVHHGTFGFI